MTAYYPAFLDVRDRRCLVIGAHPEVEGKVLRLRDAGATVVVISPAVSPAVRALADRGDIVWHRRPYRRGDLHAGVLAITAPDVRDTNAEIFDEAEAEGVLLNAMDDAPHCHFIAPAVYRQGDLTVAISTAGKAPALAVRLRDWIATLIGHEHAALVELLGELRIEVRRRIPDFAHRREVWYRLVDSDALEHLRNDEVAEARALLLDILSGTATGGTHEVREGSRS